MKNKRVQVIFLWGLLLAIVTNGSALLLGYLLGKESLSLLVAVLIQVTFALYAGYQSASSLKNDPNIKNKTELTMVGVGAAFISALISIGIDYFLTGQLKYNVGFLPIIFAGLGSYLVARKRK